MRSPLTACRFNQSRCISMHAFIHRESANSAFRFPFYYLRALFTLNWVRFLPFLCVQALTFIRRKTNDETSWPWCASRACHDDGGAS